MKKRLKNFEKYKTAEVRVNAFSEWCADRQCNSCVFSRMCGGCDERTVGIDVMAFWLELEAEEEKPLPCPFCGGEVVVGYTTNIHKEDYRQVWCKDIEMCGYYCEKRKSADDAIAAHNRVAKAVISNNKGE